LSRVIGPVYLDREPCLLAVEVEHELPDGMLAAQLHAEGAVAKDLPQGLLPTRWFFALLAGETHLIG